MLINRNNYEEFFLLYVDNELPADDRKAVEEFVKNNPDLQEELHILYEAVLTPDHDVVFANKEELYKREERKAVPFRWWRLAAAAVLLFSVGTFGWLYLGNDKPAQRHIPVADVKKNTEEKNANKEVQPETTIQNNPDSNTGPGVANENNDGGNANSAAIAKNNTGDNVNSERSGKNNAGNNVSAINKEETKTTNPAEAKAQQVAIGPAALNKKEAIKIGPSKAIEKSVTERPATGPVKTDPAELPKTIAPDIASIEESKEPPVDMAITPRKLDNQMNDVAANDASYAAQSSQPEYAADADDNIYFANTTVSKRNKLRGVFRKATRFLDKVTSLQ